MIRAAHAVVLWGLAQGRVTAVNGDEITLDEPVPMEVAGNYAIRFRSNLNVSYVCTVQTDPGEQTTVTLIGMGSVPEPGELFMFGPAGLESVSFIVQSIERGPG